MLHASLNKAFPSFFPSKQRLIHDPRITCRCTKKGVKATQLCPEICGCQKSTIGKCCSSCCFPEDAQLLLDTGEHVLVKHLTAGQRVLTGKCETYLTAGQRVLTGKYETYLTAGQRVLTGKYETYLIAGQRVLTGKYKTYFTAGQRVLTNKYETYLTAGQRVLTGKYETYLTAGQRVLTGKY